MLEVKGWLRFQQKHKQHMQKQNVLIISALLGFCLINKALGFYPVRVAELLGHYKETRTEAQFVERLQLYLFKNRKRTPVENKSHSNEHQAICF